MCIFLGLQWKLKLNIAASIIGFQNSSDFCRLFGVNFTFRVKMQTSRKCIVIPRTKVYLAQNLVKPDYPRIECENLLIITSSAEHNGSVTSFLPMEAIPKFHADAKLIILLFEKISISERILCHQKKQTLGVFQSFTPDTKPFKTIYP